MFAQRNDMLERESEFTGLKGTVLRYTGSVYALVLLSLFLKALTINPALPDDILNAGALISLIAAFVAYPIAKRAQRKAEEEAARQ